MIEVHLDCTSARRRDGMRRWMSYVQAEVVKKMEKFITVKDSRPNSQTYLIGDSLCTFAIATSENGNVLTIRLTTSDRTGKESDAAPVPALVILMVLLHLLAGREHIGAMVAVQATIGQKIFNTRAQIPQLHATLRGMVPLPWYEPYSHGIKTPEEFFTRTAK